MLEFTKMQGLGNDYVYIDVIHQEVEKIANLAQFVSDRHWGIGSDGLILIDKSNMADFKMQMFNPDGTEAEMCGNGIRCVGKFVYDKGLTNKTNLAIETLAGIKKLELHIQNGEVQLVTVDMGEPILEAEQIPVITEERLAKRLEMKVLDKKMIATCVSMGNPHAVIQWDELEKLDIDKYGKIIETDKRFPNKTNVEFVKIINREKIKMRVWERGTGETLACGTGACSAVVAGVLNQMISRKATVELLGGNLQIDWSKEDNHVYMTGPAITVFDGKLYAERYCKIETS